MTRRGLAALAATLGTALALASTAAAADSARLTALGTETFPTRGYILSLPAGSPADPGSVAVFENGQPVDSLEVTVPGASGQGVGAVLAIDASNSMKGAPITQAMNAARAFAAQRSPGFRLGVLAFNSSNRVVVPLTADGDKITRALRRTPTLAYGTRLYDAVDEARRMLVRGGVQYGSVVLLSDGADIGSKIARGQAIASAQRTRTRVFSVGLKSPQFDDSSLGRLSAATRGTFVVADRPSELRKIYSDLGSVLANEFVIRYRSLSNAAEKVFVTARVGSATAAVTTYTAPGLPGDRGSTRSLWDRLVQSDYIAAALSLLVVALVFLAVFLIARGRDRRFRNRVLQFTSEGMEQQAADRRADVNVELQQAPSGKLRELQVVTRFLEDAELAGIPQPPSVLFLYVAAGSVALAIAGVALFGTWWAVLIGLLGPVAARWYASFRLKRVRKAFGEQLPETLDVVSSALRAGHSLMGALTVAVEASHEPSRSEYGRALADEQLGVPLDDALRVVAHRMQNRDLIQVALVARLQRDAGTNAAEVLDHVSVNVRNEMELQRLIRSLTAQGRMARWIVSLLPVFLFVVLYFLNREYLEPLWQEAVGKAAMVLAGVLIVAGSLIIKKIVEITA